MQKLVEAGEITEEQAEQSERRNIILQALGPEATVKIDLTHQKVRRGDTLILCSDGLSGQVRAEEIGRVVRDEPNLMALCERLIDRANETGGPDNITVVAARFDGDGLPLSSNGDEVGHRVFATAQEREQGVSYEQLVDTREIPSVKPAPVISAPERESREAVARRWVTLVAIMALLAIGVLLWERFAA
jgi:protein phosphatase